MMELILNNVRFREEMEVDIQAMIATTAFAERRTHEAIERYGLATVVGCVDEMIDRTERAVRAEIVAMPDGTYTGESATDDDGTVLDEPVWVRVAITVEGDEMTLDFSDSDAQRPGFVNRVWAATYGTAVGSAILQMDPALADFHNEGSLRPITVVAPKGSVLNCEYPATVGGSPVAMGEQITESVTEALSKARPERALAPWGKHRGDYTSGTDTRNGRPYVRTSFDYDGSAGAVAGFDGATGPASFGCLGSVMRGNVEEAEVRFPWQVTKLEVLPDFMGAGRWRGGGGVDWRARNDGGPARMATGSSDGDEMVPAGVLGGRDCPPSRTFVQRGDELIRVKPHRMQALEHGGRRHQAELRRRRDRRSRRARPRCRPRGRPQRDRQPGGGGADLPGRLRRRDLEGRREADRGAPLSARRPGRDRDRRAGVDGRARPGARGRRAR